MPLTELWHHSAHVAAVSHVVAKRFTQINADTALLAGLLQGVGKLYLLTRAARFPGAAAGRRHLSAARRRMARPHRAGHPAQLGDGRGGHHRRRSPAKTSIANTKAPPISPTCSRVGGALAALGPDPQRGRDAVPRHAGRAPHETRCAAPAARRSPNRTTKSPHFDRHWAHEHRGSRLHGRSARVAEHRGVRLREGARARNCRRGRSSCRRCPTSSSSCRRRCPTRTSRNDIVVRVVGSEPMLAGKLMNMANSAALNTSGRKIADLRMAVARVGFNIVRSAALAFAVEQLKQSPEFKHLEGPLDGLWKNSVQIAALSHVIARRFSSLNGDTALLAGLMHNVGRIYILTRASEASDARSPIRSRTTRSCATGTPTCRRRCSRTGASPKRSSTPSAVTRTWIASSAAR